MTASIFGVGDAVNVNVNSSLIPQSFIGTAGQTLFNIASFSYSPNTNSLLVFINGQKQQSGRDFVETSSSSFTLNEGVLAGDFVDIIGFPESTTAGSSALQGALANPSDLAQGDAMIAVQQFYINSLPMTQHAINNTEVNIQSFLPQSELNAINAYTSVLDVTAGINTALQAMKRIRIPRGKYVANGQILITQRCNLRGDGMYLTQIYCGAAGIPAVKIIPTTGGAGDYTFYDITDLALIPQVAGNSTNGIRAVIDPTTYFSNFELSRLYIGDFGAEAILLDNTPASLNGFFRGSINKCWLQNGFRGISIGDSIEILENTITGTRLTTPGINISSLQGARQIIIAYNNVTTQAGSVELLNVEQAIIANNQFEHPGWIGNYLGGLSSQVYLGNVYACEIRGNTISPGNVTFPTITPAITALLLDGVAIENKIIANYIARGLTYHVGFNAASCQWNELAKDNSYAYPGTFAFFDNSGSLPNFGVPKNIPLFNAWVAFDGTSTPTVEIIEGVCYIQGEVKNGTVAAGTIIGTLPAGFAHPTRTKSFPVMITNGAAPTVGLVTVGTDGNIRAQAITAGFNVGVTLDGIQYRMD